MTYQQWIDAIAGWVDVDDKTTVASWIASAEAELNRRLRIREMQTATTTIDYTDFEITLPADYLEMATLRIGDSRALEAITPDQYADPAKLTFSGAVPGYYCVMGPTAYLLPESLSGDPFMLYYARVPNMTESEPDTVFSTTTADALLLAAGAWGFRYIKDEQRQMKWENDLSKVVDEYNGTAQRSRLGGGPLKVRSKSM